MIVYSIYLNTVLSLYHNRCLGQTRQALNSRLFGGRYLSRRTAILIRFVGLGRSLDPVVSLGDEQSPGKSPGLKNNKATGIVCVCGNNFAFYCLFVRCMYKVSGCLLG